MTNIDNETIPTGLEDAFPIKSARRPRANLGRCPAPTNRSPRVVFAEIDGKRLAEIELAGRHGKGKMMLLDAEDWERVRQFEEWWTVCSRGNGKLFIGCGSGAARRLARQSPTSNPLATLARVIMNAKKEETVRNLNGDFRDLRRENLELVNRRQHVDRMKAAGVIH